MTLIRQLNQNERDLFRSHLLSLPSGDRYTRFCSAYTDDAVNRYVDRIDFSKCDILTIEDRSGHIVGAAELYIVGNHAEMAFSVLPHEQGHGLGHALVERAILHAKTKGVEHLSLVCLSENGPMKRLAADHGMKLHTEGCETEASLQIGKPTTQEIAKELVDEACAEFAHYQAESIRRAGDAMAQSANAAINWVSMLNPFRLAFPLAYADAAKDSSEPQPEPAGAKKPGF